MKSENQLRRAAERVHNMTTGLDIATDVMHATSFMARGRGLMLQTDFPEGSALVIDPCNSIHMFFMRFPIDVLYVDREDQVVRIQEGIRPWRVGPLRTKGAKYVVELPAGTVSRTRTRPGDQISYL